MLSNLSSYEGKTKEVYDLLAQAGDEAQKAVAKGPGLVESHRAQVWVYSMQGKRQAAKSEFDLIARLSPGATLTATGVLTSVHPSGDAESLWLLGSYIGDTATKVALFQRALDLKHDLAQVQYDLGVILYYEGRLDESEAAITTALSISPNMFYAHVALGQLYLTRALVTQQEGGSTSGITTTSGASSTSDITSASGISSTVSIASPVITSSQEVSPSRSVGAYLIEARQHVDVALGQLPDYSTASIVKGGILAAQGSLQPAIRTARQGLVVNPNAGIWWFNSAAGFDDPNLFGPSIQVVKQAIAALPEYVYNYDTLGNLYVAENHLYEAQQVYSQAVTLDPSFGVAWLNLAAVQQFLGQDDASVVSARHAVSETSNWDSAYDQLGQSLVALAESKRPDLAATGGYPTATATAAAPSANCPPQADVSSLQSEAEAALRKALAVNPHNPVARTYLGRVMYDEALSAETRGQASGAKAKFDEARKELEQSAGELNEFDSQTHYLLGLVYWHDPQMHNQAAGELEKAFTIDPSDNYVAQAYQVFLLQSKSPDTSKLAQRRLDLYNSILADHPRSPLYHRQMATLYQSAGQNDRATQEYNAALKIDPTSPDLHNYLGIFYYSGGKYDLALKEFQTAWGLAPSEPVYEQNIGDAAKALADQQTQKGDPAGAAGNYRYALASYGAAAEINPSGDYHVSIGSVYVAQKQYDLAEKEYQQATRGRDAALGDLYFVQEKYDQSVQAYQRAICQSPGSASLHSSLGYVYYAGLQQVDKEISEYEIAARLAPASTSYHQYLAGAYADPKAKQYDKAVAELDVALTLDPSDASSHNQLGLLYYFDLQQTDKAISEFKLAIKLAPGKPVYHYNLGYVYYAGKQFDQAAPELKAAFDAATAGDSSRWEYAYYLGQAYYKLKRLPEAQSYLEQAVQLAPDQPDALAWLAIVYHDSGDARACATMSKALTLAESSSDPNVQANAEHSSPRGRENLRTGRGLRAVKRET